MSLCLCPEYRAAQAHKENGDQFFHNVILAYGAKLQIIVGLGDNLWDLLRGMPDQVGHDKEGTVGHDGKGGGHDGKKGGGNDGAMNGQHKTVLSRAEEGIFSMGQHEKGHFCADQLSVLTHKIS